ncbi:MFS transporter [Ornithinimicrobium sp. F0845]|uniref:MFS transporter n=1 Tax=Ornithinimicrobium sp. F0845 TaxID=2926412 RepID=UPI001FF34D9B|nr:MFS transporter [Ornithinimicrobium sp. F0845]
MLPPGRLSHPARTYLVLKGGWAFLWAVAFTLSLVYQVDVVGLTPFQLIVIGTVLETTCFLGEIPTGVVADLHSRKVSVIIGLVTIGAGVCLMAVPEFWVILAAQVVWGLGYTFVSGAAEAWVTDEVGQDAVQPVFTRGHQVSLGMTIAGILAAGFLGQAALAWPIVAGGVGFVLLGAVMAVLMREDNFAPTPRGDRDTWGHLWATTREGLYAATRHRVIRTFLLVGLLAGLTSEVLDRLWVDRIINHIGLPELGTGDDVATWFTLFALAAALVGLVASVLANRLAPAALNAEHPTRVMATLVLVEVAGVALFALSGNLGAALAGKWTRDAAQSVSWPVAHAWLNRSITNPGSRATTLSMMGQADAVGQIAGGPALGLVANRAGVQTALLLAAAIQVPAALLYARLRPRRTRR